MNEHEEARRFQEIQERRENMIQEHGWLVDYVFDTEDSKCSTGAGVDIHTHGVLENFQHPDLQIAFSISQEVAHSILTNIVEKIKSGERFESGKMYSGILEGGYKVRFMSTTEDRPMLRVVLPDSNGKLHKSTMDESFQIQYHSL